MKEWLNSKKNYLRNNNDLTMTQKDSNKKKEYSAFRILNYKNKYNAFNCKSKNVVNKSNVIKHSKTKLMNKLLYN